MTPGELSYRFKNIVLDPETGLPELPIGYVFEVEKIQVYDYGTHYLDIENVDNPYHFIYMIFIYPTEILTRYKTEVFENGKNWLGFKKLEYRPVAFNEIKVIKNEVASSKFIATIEKPTKSSLVSDIVRSRYEKRVKDGWAPKVYRAKPLNEENILYHACDAFVRWEDAKEKQAKARIEEEKQKRIEDKFLGVYPPKGLNNVRE